MQALTIVIAPAIVTNIWQTFVGRYLRDIIRRLWPLMLGTAFGYLEQRRADDRPLCAHTAPIVLGVLLVIYAVVTLVKFQFRTASQNRTKGGSAASSGALSPASSLPPPACRSSRRCRSCSRLAWRKTNWSRRSVLYFTRRHARHRPSTSPAPVCSMPATAVPGLVAMMTAFAGMFIGQAVRDAHGSPSNSAAGS